MASQRRASTPLEPSMPDSFPVRDPSLQDWLRIIAEDLDTMGELAVTVDEYKKQASTSPHPRNRSRR